MAGLSKGTAAEAMSMKPQLERRGHGHCRWSPWRSDHRPAFVSGDALPLIVQMMIADRFKFRTARRSVIGERHSTLSARGNAS